jgi:hypothetical protein
VSIGDKSKPKDNGVASAVTLTLAKPKCLTEVPVGAVLCNRDCREGDFVAKLGLKKAVCITESTRLLESDPVTGNEKTSCIQAETLFMLVFRASVFNQ